jgi:hypothetical protein
VAYEFKVNWPGLLDDEQIDVQYRACSEHHAWRKPSKHRFLRNALFGEFGASNLFHAGSKLHRERSAKHGAPHFVVVWAESEAWALLIKGRVVTVVQRTNIEHFDATPSKKRSDPQTIRLILEELSHLFENGEEHFILEEPSFSCQCVYRLSPSPVASAQESKGGVFQCPVPQEPSGKPHQLPEAQRSSSGGRLNTDEQVLAAIWARHGQPDFRDRLLQAYGSRCAITGCDVVDALDAAHITPYAEEHDYALTNGILLRADIHTLFDLFLLSVDPSSWTVRIAPSLAGAYGELEGKYLVLPTESLARPDRNRLARHHAEWGIRWCSTSR